MISCYSCEGSIGRLRQMRWSVSAVAKVALVGRDSCQAGVLLLRRLRIYRSYEVACGYVTNLFFFSSHLICNVILVMMIHNGVPFKGI
jgi:hypothetical protein